MAKHPEMHLALEKPLPVNLDDLIASFKTGSAAINFYELGEIRGPKRYNFFIEPRDGAPFISYYTAPFEGYAETIPGVPEWLVDVAVKDDKRREGVVLHMVFGGVTYRCFSESPFYPPDLGSDVKVAEDTFRKFMQDQLDSVVLWGEG